MLLEVEGARVNLVVATNDVVGALEVAVEEHCGLTGDALGHRRRKANQFGLRFAEIGVERTPQFLHQPNLPVMYCSVRSSSGVENIFAVRPCSTSTPVRRSLSGFTSVV
jgi:hypothetical protein